MAIKIIRRTPEVPAKPEDETILQALTLVVLPGNKRTLMLVHKETGATWQVILHNPQTKRTTLRDSNGLTISPILTDKENALYYPLWR